MAKINGIEVKNLTSFTGHDGPGYLQGNVYYNKKKLGFWSEDAWCGPDQFNFDKDLLKDPCNRFQQGFDDSDKYKEYKSDPSIVIHEVCRLREIEKLVMKFIRKGYPAVIFVTDKTHLIAIAADQDMNDEVLLARHAERIEKAKSELFENVKPVICVFRSKMDFEFVVDKDHPAPDIFRS